VPLVSPGPRAFATFLISAADLLNDRVFPVCDSHEVTLLRVLTDRRSEFCGNPEQHEYELYLAVEDIDHSRSKSKSPQTRPGHRLFSSKNARGGGRRKTPSARLHALALLVFPILDWLE
jgi:hypothetical protein